MRAAIVSGADSGYFPLLMDLMSSIRASPESQTIDLCVLDFGLLSDQRDALASLVTQIVSPPWDFDFDFSGYQPGFKAMTSRPHLPKHFPGYDIYIWIDADAWLCNWDAIRLLLSGAQFYKLAIIPELDRSYASCFAGQKEISEQVTEVYREAFGPEVAERFGRFPVINSGVFAMQGQVPFWNIWSNLLRTALLSSRRMLVEQCALNVGIYTGEIQAHFLPSWCNWHCAGAVPILDPARRDLFVPMLPHERISICHLTAAKVSPQSVQCFDNTLRNMSLTYQSVRIDPLPPPADSVS